MKAKLSPILRLSFVIVLLFSSLAAAPFSQPNRVQTTTQDLLDALGGAPCFDWSIFTCVTIEVPLDHFNPADTRTIPVTFAVLPASGARKGMFVTATGGPGYSGVASADSYTAAFDPAIPAGFDIVFFDQRGLLLSGDQTCPFAANVYYQQETSGLTPAQEAALKQAANAFSTDCVNEVSSPDLLPYLGTRQAVEDLEYFRQLIGDERFWLYGESYGTRFAQTYAAVHGEHLSGLILDGTVDLTYDGITYYTQQAQAFNDTLVAALSACNDDPTCNTDLLGDAISAYDDLTSQLSARPISFRFPLPLGGFANRRFTLSNFEFVAASQMYTESDRMMFVRALAAYTANGTLVPLARLLYIDLGLDPQTLEVVLDPYYSDAVFFGVECQDYGYPGNSPDEKADLYLTAADPFEASIPRLSSIIYGDLPCAYWPSAT
ncbi:MAG TPA: alpha/beta fold hydrolase, partial [Anaerolineales bacterium]|nr:alpha/beta fold hydrolase [Anaerolineales bacterium]